MKTYSICFLIILLNLPGLYGAVGCDLNDPDRDVKRFFPSSTGYKTLYFSIEKKGGNDLLKKIESRLGDDFKGIFETAGVPYTMYRIYKGKELIGYIHGVNQKGEYGGIQVFLALNTEGKIVTLYFQKLSSKSAAKLRSPDFSIQFSGLDLSDFYSYNPKTGKAPDNNRIFKISNPAPDAQSDFLSTLRGIKKNLILVDEFLLGNKYLKYFEE